MRSPFPPSVPPVTTPAPITRQKVTWRWAEDTETVDILRGPDGWRATGRHGATMFWLSVGPDFAARRMELLCKGPDRQGRLILDRTRDGWQMDSGTMIPDSAPALDLDLACTALTNTLPIRRLALGDGESAEIAVLYLPVPDLTPEVQHHRYTRHGDSYDYENLTSGFHARIAVDREGLVQDYPGVCHRLES